MITAQATASQETCLCGEQDHVFALHKAKELALSTNNIIYVYRKNGLYFATAEYNKLWIIKAYPGGRSIFRQKPD